MGPADARVRGGAVHTRCILKRWAAACATLVALLAEVPAASAELGEDALRIANAWQKHGDVVRLPPRLAERGAPTVIFLPPKLASGAKGTCTSVVLLAPISTHFTARAVGSDSGFDDWPQASLAGMTQITRCGARRAAVGTILVEMRSPRAVLETLVVETAGAAPPAIEVLPRRNPGPIEPMAPPGPRPAPAPIEQRLARATRKAVHDGATGVEREVVQSSPRGTGKVGRVVEAGCYRIALLAEPNAAAEGSVDLSIEPELDAASSSVVVEQGDGLDAAITLCAGARSTLNVGFDGAPPGANVHVIASGWPLPDHLPEAWGSTGRARVAAALFRHRARIDESPIDHSLGVQGPTLMPIAVEPGACYVAVLAAVRGTPQALALGVVAGEVTAQNRAAPGDESTLVSFCARSRANALFEADSRGIGVFWLFALFQNGRIAVGGGRN